MEKKPQNTAGNEVVTSFYQSLQAMSSFMLFSICATYCTLSFKKELIDYLDYYNNRRIKAKLMGLPPAIHRQQALSVA